MLQLSLFALMFDLGEGDQCPHCNQGRIEIELPGPCGCGWPDAHPPCWNCTHSYLVCIKCHELFS